MSKIGLGIIGLGYIFNEYLKVILKISDFKIVGVLTKSNIKSKKFVKNNKQIKVYENIEEMMKDKKVQAVLVLVNAADKNCINLTKIIAKAKIENPSKTNITGPPFDIKSKLFRLFKFMNSSNSIKKHNSFFIVSITRYINYFSCFGSSN